MTTPAKKAVRKTAAKKTAAKRTAAKKTASTRTAASSISRTAIRIPALPNRMQNSSAGGRPILPRLVL